MYRIYYDDGTTYQGDPYNAPAFGVLVIIEDDPEAGRVLIENGDYYCYREARWYAMDIIGLFDYLASPGEKKVIFGRIVPNELFREVHKHAMEDTDFPKKTADGYLKSRH